MSSNQNINRRQWLKLSGLLGLSSFLPASAAASTAKPTTSKGFVSTPFGDVFYKQSGTGDDVVCIHQSAQCSEEFSDFQNYLSKHFRVTLIDLPGHGHSDTPPHELSMQEYTDSIVQVMDALSITSSHLVGNHGGAALTIDLAIRFNARIKRIVAVGLGRGEALDLDSLKDQPMTRDLPVDSDGDFLQKTWQVYTRMSARETPPHITYKPFLVSLQQRQRPYDMHHAAYRWDYYPHVKDVNNQILLLKADQDPFAGDTEGLSKQFKHATFNTITAGGVWVFYEQPKACADTIATFLNT